MKKYVEIQDVYKCTGCGACYNVCPVGCIKMITDEEGFNYPIVDTDICISCGKCKKTCPISEKDNEIVLSGAKDVYACINKDKTVLKESSSGGVFTSIAKNILNSNGVVFGAVYDSKFNVEHTYIDTEQDLCRMRGSKYVQSDIKNSFADAKNFLDKGKKVLFSGAPCQIAGLKSFLNKEYDNLITCDFICTGVPSPLIYNAYTNYYIEKYSKQPVDIKFRNKRKGWYNFDFCIDFENKSYSKSRFFDPYIQGFYSHLFLRPSCYSCQFKGLNSGSDIKIADYWDVDKVHPNLNDYNGVSLVILSSSKAVSLFNAIKPELIFEKSSMDNAIKTNGSLSVIVKEPENRRLFFNEIKNMKSNKDIFKILQKYTSSPLLSRVRTQLMLLKRELIRRFNNE